MSQEKLSLIQEAFKLYPLYTYAADVNFDKRSGFIAGAKFREAQLVKIVNVMKEKLESIIYASNCDLCYSREKAQDVLTNVNKALDEMGLK